jgi:hypothetical protein
MFNLKKLNEVAGKVRYPVEVKNRFAVTEDFDTEVKINSAWEIIRGHIQIFSQGVSMKNAVFWDVMPCGSCKNRHSGETWRFHHQGDKNR